MSALLDSSRKCHLLPVAIRRRLFIVLFMMAFCGTQTSLAQTLPYKRSRAVYGSDYYVSPSQYDYQGVANTMVSGATSDYEKAKRIYLWLCNNIKYDNQTDIRTADECWKNKRAVCQGYCELFFRLAKTQGISADIVYGQSKSPNGLLQPHAWLRVKTVRGYILADPTLGAGAKTHSGNASEWFDVDPYWMIFTHFPKKKSSQQLANAVSESEFSRLPFAEPSLSLLGWQAKDALGEALVDGATFPFVSSSLQEYVHIIKAPKERILHIGQTYTFSVRKLATCKVSLKDGRNEMDEKQWQNTPESLTVNFTPVEKGTLQLLVEVKQTGFFSVPFTYVEYEVE